MPWLGLLLSPLPPSAPSEDYLRHSGHLPPDSATSVPQPAPVVPFYVLVTLPSALPRPFLTFEGPGGSSRAPSSMQGPRNLLPDHFLGSLVIAQMGLWHPSFQPVLVAPCPAASQRWSFCNDLPKLCGLPAGPLPSQMNPGLAVKNPLSYPLALGSIYRQDRQWKTPCPTPCSWLDLLPGPAVKNPLSYPPCLARFFSCLVPFPRHV